MNNQNLTELSNRKLDPCYFCLYCFPFKIFINEGDNNVNTQDIYIFMACNVLGVRKYITTVYLKDYLKTSLWYDLFQSFKEKGLETILYALLPDNKSLKDALRLSFKDLEFILSCYDSINKIQKYFPLKYTSLISEQIKRICLAQDLTEFSLKKDEFIENYKENKFILDLLEKDFKICSQSFSYPYLLRKHIYSFYFSRELYKKLTVISHKKPHFTSIDDFITYLLPSIQLFESRMYTSKKEWISLINLIYTSKKDLLIPYL